ncbi:HTH domain-containing protein [[Eubacterium] hominis]
MFTGRQKKIIELIAGNVQGIYGSTIASTLQVSSRTVRNEIQTINNL